MQVGFRKLPGRRPRHVVLRTQPLTEPLSGVSFHRSVGFADRTETEIVAPSNHNAVESSYHRLLIQQGLVPSGFAANRLADANHPLLRRNGTQIGTPRLRRVTSTERI